MPLFALEHRELEVVQGDITRVPADAIVNAANSHLAGGGGVDGAIHLAGGPAIMCELDAIRSRIGQCPTGSAVATGAGRLPAKFVFHAVGPIYRGGRSGEADLLASCYVTCLNLAAERGVVSIAFPSISTGIYGYPIMDAAQIAAHAILGWCRAHQGAPALIKLVQFSASDHRVYARCLEQMLSGSGA